MGRKATYSKPIKVIPAAFDLLIDAKAEAKKAGRPNTYSDLIIAAFKPTEKKE